MRHVVLLVAALALTQAALAQNIGFARGGPMERMNKDDMKLLTDNYVKALEQAADGQISEWTNPKTGHSGSATPKKSFERAGQKCRLVELNNTAGGASGKSEFTFCKQASGEWKIVE
jgi:surface antigen